MAQGNKPAAKFRVGFTTVTVWKNDGGFYSASLQRSYKDDQGDWQNTDQLNHGDLLNAAKALERAEAFIADQQ